MSVGQSTVLVVEDDKSLRDALIDRFELAGFHVESASDGREGLRVALESHPDVVLMDLMMPKMNGEEMLEELRRDDWGKGALVVVLTNMTYVNDKESLGRTDEFILKSDTKLEELVEKVKSKLN